MECFIYGAIDIGVLFCVWASGWTKADVEVWVRMELSADL